MAVLTRDYLGQKISSLPTNQKSVRCLEYHKIAFHSDILLIYMFAMIGFAGLFILGYFGLAVGLILLASIGMIGYYYRDRTMNGLRIDSDGLKLYNTQSGHITKFYPVTTFRNAWIELYSTAGSNMIYWWAQLYWIDGSNQKHKLNLTYFINSYNWEILSTESQRILGLMEQEFEIFTELRIQEN
jgi:hypothetical protein